MEIFKLDKNYMNQDEFEKFRETQEYKEWKKNLDKKNEKL